MFASLTAMDTLFFRCDSKSIETHKDVRGDLELTMFVPNSYGHYLSVHEYADRFGAPNSSIGMVGYEYDHRL